MIGEPDSNDPLVVPTQGHTPNCWEDRSVIFVANLLSLFFGNRGGAERLEEEISCVDSYGGRLLPVLGLIFGGADNVLVLERPPDPALTDFFRSLGLKAPAIELCPRADFLDLGERLGRGETGGHPLLERLRGSPSGLVDGFVTDDTIARLARTLGKRTLSTVAGSQRGNNKLLLHQHLESAGLPVFPTRLAGSPAEVPAALAELRRDGHRRAVAKAQIGASGIGMMKMATDAPPPPALSEAFFHEGPCMVQAWLEPGAGGIERVLSPSVQLFLNDDSAYLYDVTEQILDPEESVHEGNESPPESLDEYPELLDELHRQAGEAAGWLHHQGYRGAASVDFLVTCGGGGFTAYVCEINARVTGATYPSVLARHFRPDGAWRMRNLELARSLPGEMLLEKLREHAELYDGGGRDGVLPVNFNLDPDGLVRKGQFLAIGDDVATCRRLLDTARHDLPVAWDYTRDR